VQNRNRRQGFVAAWTLRPSATAASRSPRRDLNFDRLSLLEIEIVAERPDRR
jgi:hypothetical protein